MPWVEEFGNDRSYAILAQISYEKPGEKRKTGNA